MTIEIRDTAIENIVNGLRIIEQNMKYWEELALDAKRNNAADFITKGFEQKAENYNQQLFAAKQVLCELGGEFYDSIMDKVRAN